MLEILEGPLTHMIVCVSDLRLILNSVQQQGIKFTIYLLLHRPLYLVCLASTALDPLLPSELSSFLVL